MPTSKRQHRRGALYAHGGMAAYQHRKTSKTWASIKAMLARHDAAASRLQRGMAALLRAACAYGEQHRKR